MPASIVSGGLIRETRGARVALAPLPYTETWSVSNHAGLNGDKSWTMGAVGWVVDSQQALLTGGGGAASRGQCNVDTGTDDYQVTIQVPTYTPDVVGVLAVGPCVRMQGDASLTFYTGVISTTGGGTTLAVLYKFVSGVQTALGSPVTVTPHAGMTLSLRAVGSFVRMLFDGAPVISATDSAIPTGRFAGLQGVGQALNLVRVDNLTVAAAVSTGRTVPLDLLSLTPMAGVH